MNEHPHGLTASERLNASDINRLFNSGHFAGGKFANVRLCPNGLAYNRIGVAVSRKAGKANRRNRVRRRLKAAYQKIKPDLVMGFDLVIIARYGVNDADFTVLCEQLRKVCEKGRRLVEEDAQHSENHP